MRQELLTKPDPPSKSATKDKSAKSHPIECTWSEPFVLYYDDAQDLKSSTLREENNLKFSIGMVYDEILQTKKNSSVKEHQIGESESFQLDQFSEGEIYLKEIRFGSK